MTAYEPDSRRSIADVLRKTAHGSVGLCVRWNIHPDAISYASVAAAAAAGVCFWQAGAASWLLIPAAGFCYLRLWCNMLDGMVALASGKASRRGEILNEIPDRVSDVAIFVGTAHSGLCHVLGGYWVAIFAVFVAYIGTFGQAMGTGRQFGGLMSKPWRMVALHVGAWMTLAAVWWNEGQIEFSGLTILDWTFLAIIIGSLQTIAVRLGRIVKNLNTESAAS
ncbi:MAG: CDP-alcohol phosphatidyltransferase family protein [Planctomycetaceae bacterium]|nr:CDP-alcohol phosphatidyltransferase family protein [Planctomycetaceae bacterium]